jgi:hypothetical protein
MISSHLITDLPQHIIESAHFTHLRALCPDETHIDILDEVYVSNFVIDSQAKFDQIIRSDCYFDFDRKVYAEIFRNLERFWREDPNSSPFQLPQKDISNLSNQMITLFTERQSSIIMTCMKRNQIELFDYIVERDGRGIILDEGMLRVFPLLYYAITNNHIEITKHGIEKGCMITDDLMKPAVQNNNLEIARILFESRIPITTRLERAVCEFASIKMLHLFLEYYKKPVVGLLQHAIHNFENLKELLLLMNEIELSRELAFNLLGTCLKYSVDVRVILLIEAHFVVCLRELRAENVQMKYFNSNYIHTNIIVEDNLDLYMHLYNSGFLVCEGTYHISIHYLCRKITPGLVRKHIRDSLDKE